MLRQPLLFIYWSPKYLDFWFTTFFLTQLVKPPLVTHSLLYSTCLIYRTSCYATIHQMLPTHSFPRVLQVLESVFYSQVFFCLQLLPAAFKSFLGPAVHAHIPNPTIISNDSSTQKRYSGRFYLCA